jgi:hypothetical protein
MGVGLTDEQLLQVFKQTSIFNVRSALAGNESLVDGTEADGMDRCGTDDPLTDQFSTS